MFDFPQLGCVNATQWQHDCWNANEADNYGEGNWAGRLAQLCKTKKVDKIVPASQFAEAADQFQLVKRAGRFLGKGWTAKMNSTRIWPTTRFHLTPGEEEQEFDEDIRSIEGNCSFALNSAVQETCAKRKVNAKKNIDMLVKVRKSPVGGCAKNSFDAQPAWRTVSIAIDSGACDNVTSPEHVPDHKVHESLETQRGENFQSATGEPIPHW